MININNTAANVTIRRVWFTGGSTTTSGGTAIDIDRGTVTLESCIFSGNTISGNYIGGGGAVRLSNGTTANVSGCTFYNNRSEGNLIDGGAISTDGGSLTFTGNLFYANRAALGALIAYGAGAPISNGYNVGNGPPARMSGGSGTFAVHEKDILSLGNTNVTDSERITISTVSLRPIPGRSAVNVIDTIPEGYPAEDFYGNAITAGAAAGAIQDIADGYIIFLSVNNSDAGSISVDTPTNAEGLYSGTVTITASPASDGYKVIWFVDDVETAGIGPNTVQLTLTGHASVRAKFSREWLVTVFDSDDASTEGTLRYAITNAGDDDIVRVRDPGQTIQLASSRLAIQKAITIEGNGLTLTSSMTAGTNSQLMYTSTSNSMTITIRRVWFKDASATSNGGAIYVFAGNLTLESCIFSGNQNSSSTSGGAIQFSGNGTTLNVKGCTFYNNRATNTSGRGGVVYTVDNTSTMIFTGNLFYQNTSGYQNPVVYSNGTVISNGYNVVDRTMGTDRYESGWVAASGDKTIATILGSNNTTPFADTATLAPKSELSNATNGIPAATWTVGSNTASMPATDFYGNARTWPGAAGAVR
jgi:hypothetical protein